MLLDAVLALDLSTLRMKDARFVPITGSEFRQQNAELRTFSFRYYERADYFRSAGRNKNI